MMDAETRQYLEGMKAELFEQINGTRLELLERIETTETKLLSEFWKWSRDSEARMKRIESSDATIIERMGNLSERVFTLERKVAGSKE